MKVTVTGAESFIGRALISLLRERDVEVTGIDTIEPSFAGGIVADIRVPEFADHLPGGTHAVVHLAAVSRERDCASNPRLAFDVNVTGTVNVLAAAQRRGVRQVLFASSEWVYGDVGNEAIQDEDTVIDPRRVLNEYAASKLAGEMALNVAVRRGLQAGTVLRFGIVYGPRPANWSAVEALLQTVRTTDEITVGSLATARRFIHVRDVAAGVIAALGHPGFDIFNLSGADLVSLKRVIEISLAVTGRRPRIIERNPTVVSIRNPVSAKAARTLGWRPIISMGDGIAELATYLDGRDVDRSDSAA
jgi:UDP-glucose 4-epimerase